MQRTLTLLGIAVLLFALAPSASAIVACEDCPANASPSTRCIGICNGMVISYCFDWFYYGCGSFRPAEPSTEEQAFIDSLNQDFASPEGGAEAGEAALLTPVEEAPGR